jgi:hypothetical protein
MVCTPSSGASRDPLIEICDPCLGGDPYAVRYPRTMFRNGASLIESIFKSHIRQIRIGSVDRTSSWEQRHDIRG